MTAAHGPVNGPRRSGETRLTVGRCADSSSPSPHSSSSPQRARSRSPQRARSRSPQRVRSRHRPAQVGSGPWRVRSSRPIATERTRTHRDSTGGSTSLHPWGPRSPRPRGARCASRGWPGPPDSPSACERATALTRPICIFRHWQPARARACPRATESAPSGRAEPAPPPRRTSTSGSARPEPATPTTTRWRSCRHRPRPHRAHPPRHRPRRSRGQPRNRPRRARGQPHNRPRPRRWRPPSGLGRRCAPARGPGRATLPAVCRRHLASGARRTWSPLRAWRRAGFLHRGHRSDRSGLHARLPHRKPGHIRFPHRFQPRHRRTPPARLPHCEANQAQPPTHRRLAARTSAGRSPALASSSPPRSSPLRTIALPGPAGAHASPACCRFSAAASTRWQRWVADYATILCPQSANRRACGFGGVRG